MQLAFQQPSLSYKSIIVGTGSAGARLLSAPLATRLVLWTEVPGCAATTERAGIFGLRRRPAPYSQGMGQERLAPVHREIKSTCL